MSRQMTARKKTTFNEAAVEPAAFNPLFPLFRAGPEPAAAGKQALRLLTGFTLVGLPVHCGICWLAGQSLGLAVVAVLALAAALLAVALARWLALDDLLQRLPLLVLLGLAGLGLVFVTSLPARGWGPGGMEMWGLLFILIAVVSVLASLYRPLAGAYQAVTLKMPFRDLCVTAAAMLVSLALAAAGQTLPRPVLPLLTCVLGGTLAGLVVVEYAAWARANPARGLERARAFDEPPAAARGTTRKPPKPFDARAAVRGAAAFGLCYGLVATIAEYGVGPTSELHRMLPPPQPGEPGSPAEFLATVALFGLVGLPFAWFGVSSALNALRAPNPVLALRVAWDAIVVFLTYPGPGHPLAHRLHTPWLRPQSVRLAATCVVLLTAATTFIAPAVESPKADPEKKVPATTPAYPPPAPQYVPPADPWLARTERGTRDDFADAITGPSPALPYAPPPTEPPASEPRSVGTRVTAFAAAAVTAAVGPPAFVLLMIWFVGLSVLPTYFSYFEKPDDAAASR